MSTVQEEAVPVMREQDVTELKEGIKELQKTLHAVDKEVSIHTSKFENLGNVKELAEKTSESSKSAHKRIDEVEKEIKEEISEVKLSQEKQFKDFKKLVESSNKTHEDNFKSIKAFGLKVFFLFATPFTVGLIGVFWLIFNKGLGIEK